MPSEFWQMTPSEFTVLLQAAKPEETRGSLRERDLEQLSAELESGDYL